MKRVLFSIVMYLFVLVVSAADAKTVVDLRERTVEVPDDVRRVVVSFNMEEFIAAAGERAVPSIVGWSHRYWRGRREDALAVFTAAYPELLERADVGYNDSISTEEIIALAPEVVLMSSPVNFTRMENDIPRLEAAGIKIVFFDFHAQTPETHRRSIELIGAVMGTEERAAEIADFYDAQMKIVSDRVAKVKDEDRPKVYMEFSLGAGRYGNSWSKRMWGKLIEACGGRNIARDLSDGNEVDVAPEFVIAEDPDVVVFTASPRKDVDDNIVLGYGAQADGARSRLAAYKERAGWSGLSAVRSGRMGALYHDLSRHIFDFAGAQFLAKMLHPDLFADVDPSAALAGFFTKYLPGVAADGAFVVSLK